MEGIQTQTQTQILVCIHTPLDREKKHEHSSLALEICNQDRGYKSEIYGTRLALKFWRTTYISDEKGVLNLVGNMIWQARASEVLGRQSMGQLAKRFPNYSRICD